MAHSVTGSLRRHMVVAFALLLLLIGGLGGAAALVQVNGAVVAPGTVVVETNVKRVQHQEGGIVREILVREGQSVQAGDLLVRLDETLPRANLSITSTRLEEFQAQEARLKAERDSQSALIVPQALAGREKEPNIATVLDGQRALMAARTTSRKGRKSQLAEQISQFEEKIRGLSAQRDAKAQEISLIAQELQDLASLYEKGLVQRVRITALKRDRARLEGERGGLVSAIAEARQAISERRIQILQIDEQMRAEVVEQLQAVRAEISKLAEQKVAAVEQLRRVDIRAPRSGIIHKLAVHTVGGVVAASEDLMLVVPGEDVLIIEVQIAPNDIDELTPSQEAVIRFTGLDQRSTPELKARIVNISPDLLHNQQTGIPYYQARLALAEEELAKLDGKELIPGMPVEAFVQTGARTILSYLTKPITDHIVHSFRDG